MVDRRWFTSHVVHQAFRLKASAPTALKGIRRIVFNGLLWLVTCPNQDFVRSPYGYQQEYLGTRMREYLMAISFICFVLSARDR